VASVVALDKDGTGVDKLEFVVGMLIHLGVDICGSPLQVHTPVTVEDVRIYAFLMGRALAMWRCHQALPVQAWDT
jgi:hypothetical protein